MEFKVEVGEDNVPFINVGEYILRLDLEDLNEYYKERAMKELRETPEVAEKALEKLRRRLKEEDGLKVPDDAVFLYKFLRPCKFYPESTFLLMKKYFKFRVKHPKYGVATTPNDIRHVYDQEVMYVLPTRTDTGSRLLIINVGTKWNPKKVSLDEIFRAAIVAVETAMMEPKTQVAGVQVILNMEGLSWIHFYQFSPFLAKLITEFVQECLPIRLKAIHIINQPFIFNMVYAIFKPFLQEKLKQRLFFHGTNRKSLTEKIPKRSLPTAFGGESLPDYPGSLLGDILQYYQSDFDLVNSYGYSLDKIEDD